jgi:hypothetical protein
MAWKTRSTPVGRGEKHAELPGSIGAAWYSALFRRLIGVTGIKLAKENHCAMMSRNGQVWKPKHLLWV